MHFVPRSQGTASGAPAARLRGSMETQPVGAESIRLDVVKRMFAAFDVDLAETRNERTNELLASMMAGLLSGEGSIPADLVRRALAAYGVDVTEKRIKSSPGTNDFTLLHKAVCDEDDEMVAASLAVGCEVDAQWRISPACPGTDSAMNLAAGGGRIDTLRMLIAAGADLNANSPLSSAASNGCPSCVRLLLAAGADVNGDGSRFPPVFYAAANGHPQTMRVLLAAGADTNGQELLHLAVKRGKPAMFQALLDAGIDINARDGWGRTPLEGALYYGQRKCLEPLLRAGATFEDESLAGIEREGFAPVVSICIPRDRDAAWRYMDRVQEAGGYDQLVQIYRRVLTAPRSCLVKYIEFRFGRPAPADIVPSVLEFWKPPGGG